MSKMVELLATIKMERRSDRLQPVEIKMMLSAFSSMETIHVVAYSHLVETLGMPDDIYTEFLKYKEILYAQN